MNTPLRCGPGRQPCPNPMLCNDHCHFTNASDLAAVRFWAMQEPEPTSGIEKPDWIDAAVAWVQRHLIRIAAVCAVISFVVGCTAMLGLS